MTFEAGAWIAGCLGALTGAAASWLNSTRLTGTDGWIDRAMWAIAGAFLAVLAYSVLSLLGGLGVVFPASRVAGDSPAVDCRHAGRVGHGSLAAATSEVQRARRGVSGDEHLFDTGRVNVGLRLAAGRDLVRNGLADAGCAECRFVRPAAGAAFGELPIDGDGGHASSHPGAPRSCH